jgi:hypothetical protein
VLYDTKSRLYAKPASGFDVQINSHFLPIKSISFNQISLTMKLNWHMIFNVAVAVVIVFIAREIYLKSRARQMAAQQNQPA